MRSRVRTTSPRAGVVRRRGGAAGRAFGAALLAVLAGCGASGDDVARPIRILDAEGRLYARDRAEVVLRTNGRRSGHVWSPAGDDDPRPLAVGAPDAELVEVRVPGHRVERVPMVAGGETVVRLRRGIAVTLGVRWEVEPPAALRRSLLGLESEDGGLRSATAACLFDDAPTLDTEAEIAPSRGEVQLFVPQAGRYRVLWRVEAREVTAYRRSEDVVEVGEDGLVVPATVLIDAGWLAWAQGWARR